MKVIAVESAFSAYSDMANDKIRGVGILLRDRYNVRHYVGKIASIPLLLLHGTNNNVISHLHSQTLYDLAQEPKQLIFVNSGQYFQIGTLFAQSDWQKHRNIRNFPIRPTIRY